MKNVKDELEKIFSSLGIEYFAVLNIKDVKIIKPYLIERLDFTPYSAVIFLVPYYAGDAENLSVYAAARDYHIFIKEAGGRVSDFLKNGYGKNAASFGDHSPIDERLAAAMCGLGLLGDSGLLLNEKYGSYIFIGEILTDLDPETLGAKEPAEPLECRHCGRCKTACPMPKTGECLSALTQKKGTLTKRERAYIKEYGSIWGCDLCQSSCPHNKDPKITPVDFFKKNRTPKITRALIEGMSEAEFFERAYAWRGKTTLMRNIEIFDADN